MNDLAHPMAGTAPVAGAPIQPRVLVVEDAAGDEPPAAAPGTHAVPAGTSGGRGLSTSGSSGLSTSGGRVRSTIARDIAGWFDVRSESDGVSAWLALLCDESIRAVIADVESNAWFNSEVLLDRMRVSSLPRLHRIPVIVLTADDPEASSRARQRAPAATAYVPRSVPHVALVEHIEALIHGLAPPAHALVPRKTGRAASGPDQSTSPALPTTPVSDRSHLETPMARFDSLNKILKQLQTETPGVEASALISEDGLMIASALPQDLDDMRVAGMTATLLNLGTRAATELRRGDVREVIVRGEAGYAVTISAGRGAVLLVLAGDSTPLGLIFFDMREAVKSIKTVL